MLPCYPLNTDGYIKPSSQKNIKMDTEEMIFSDQSHSTKFIEEGLIQNQNCASLDEVTEALITNSEGLCIQLDKLNGDLLASLTADELPETERMLATMENMLKQGEDITLSTRPGTAEHQLVVHLRHELRRHPTATFYERGQLMIDFIGGLLSNDFTLVSGTASRRLANVISVAMRTGTIVALTTLLRQLTGFALENRFRLLGTTASLPPRMVAGILSMILGPALNLAGAVRDERNGTASTASRASRIAMGLLSAGALAMVASHRPDFTLGTLMGSFGVQTLTYTLTRDLLQLFFPLHDNGGVNAGGLLSASVFYGVAQGALGVAMENLAPHSGAGYVMVETDRIARHMADWASVASVAAVVIQPNIIHDLLRSALNAIAEIFDDLQRPAMMRVFTAAPQGTRHSGNGVFTASSRTATSRQEGVRIGLGRPRWPSADQVAEQFLTTNAMRTSYFESVVSIALTAASALRTTRLAPSDQVLVVNTLVAGLVMAGYPAFIAVHMKRQAAPVGGQ